MIYLIQIRNNYYYENISPGKFLPSPELKLKNVLFVTYSGDAEGMEKIFALFILITVSFGCSRSSTSQATFQIKLSSLVAGTSTFTGGAVVRVKNPLTNTFTSFDLTTTNVIEIPKGTWQFYFVGFEGASAWGSPYRCGVANSVTLSKDTETINITATAANCSGDSTYMAMIIAKDPSVASQWDVGNWDSALWGP